MRLTLLLLAALAMPAAADPSLDRLVAATTAAFPRVPAVEIVDDLGPVCGGGATGPGVYCTSEATIFLPSGLRGRPEAPYVLAHLYGHGLQVAYGVADLALAAITADRAREMELRGMVERQVECLAGVLLRRAGFDPPDLASLFPEEPFTGAHWGRRPVRSGPAFAIGQDARTEWLAMGHAAGTAAACTVGEMPADLIAAVEPG